MRTYLGWEKVSALARHCFRSKCTQKSLGIGPGLVSGLDEVDCMRKSSASYQLEVVALLLLEMKVKDDRPS